MSISRYPIRPGGASGLSDLDDVDVTAAQVGAVVAVSEVGPLRFGLSRPPAHDGRGAICISMDDAYIAMDQVRQWMDARGQKGTFCVTPGLMGGGTKITDAHIVTMVANGHEVAVHGNTHANYSSELSAAQRLAESTAAKSYLENVTGQTVTTFCYPYGTDGRDPTTDTELYPLFERILDTAANTQVSLHPRFGEPPSLVRRTPWTEDNLEQAKAMVRLAAARPVIGSLFFHNLDTSVNPTSAQVLAVLDLAVELGVPLLTASEAFGAFRTLGDPSFEDNPVGTTTSPHPWHLFTAEGGTSEVVTVAPDTGLAGTQALRLAVPAGPGTVHAYVRQAHPVIPGRTYTLSFRAKVFSGVVAQANDAYGRIQGLDYAQVDIGSPALTAAPVAGAWVKFSIDYAVPQDVAFVNVDLVVTGVAAGAAVDFDHVWFGPKQLGDLG